MQCDGCRPSCRSCLAANAKCAYIDQSATLKQRVAELEGAYDHVKRSYDTLRESAFSAWNSEDVITQMGDNLVGPSTLIAQHDHSPCQAAEMIPRPALNWKRAGFPERTLPLSRWTSVSSDEGLLNRLFSLFWTWDHSLARILHRDLLLESLTAEQEAPGEPDTQYCSEFLINAILAVSMVGRNVNASS